jgi:hypothetical protein
VKKVVEKNRKPIHLVQYCKFASLWAIAAPSTFELSNHLPVVPLFFFHPIEASPTALPSSPASEPPAEANLHFQPTIASKHPLLPADLRY